MSVAPASTSSVLVAVSGVLQDPSTYSVSGTTLTFSGAPPSGTSNISVRYLGIPASGVTTTAYRTVTEFTATSGQTSFSVPSYTVGFIDVYRNGVMLGSADYTATSGTTVVLAAGATVGDLVEVISFQVSSVLNAIPATAGSVGTSNIANGVTINFADGSASTPSITNDGDTNTGMFFPAADTIAFAEGGAEVARFDSSGNLGIGVSPTDTGGFGRAVDAYSASGAAYYARSSSGVMDFGLSGTSGYIWNRTNGSIQIATNNTERMRIDSSGNLLVNTTSPGAGAGFATKVAISGEDSFLSKSAGQGATSVVPGRFWHDATSGNNVFVSFATETSYTQRGTIDYNRGANQVRYNTTSDATLKNLIGDSDKQKSLEILESTRIREYTWKEDTEQKPQIGVIAQELFETYKGAVCEGGKDANDNYRPWGVDKTAFTFHLIAGWQEHQRIIQEQQAIITDLKARVEALENK
jgi:hypothetical protein